jgi:hypothetical protein
MSSRPALGPTQPPIQWVQGALSPGVKRQGHEADHSPPTSAKVKKMCIYPLPHMPSWHQEQLYLFYISIKFKLKVSHLEYVSQELHLLKTQN